MLWFYLQTCSESDLPLEGAKDRLEELKESLYQREREITELLEAERSPIPPVHQPPCSVLLPTVIHKVISIVNGLCINFFLTEYSLFYWWKGIPYHKVALFCFQGS